MINDDQKIGISVLVFQNNFTIQVMILCISVCLRACNRIESIKQVMKHCGILLSPVQVLLQERRICDICITNTNAQVPVDYE